MTPLDRTPLQYLFHDTHSSVKRYRRSIIPFVLNAAKCLIPRHWKQSTTPTLGEWKREVNGIMEAERTMLVSWGQQSLFQKIRVGWRK